MTYEYLCTACRHAWEAEQSISEAPLKDCPHCGQACAKRQVSGGQGFILKGGGWYADGYGSKGQPSKDSESRTDSKGESKGESKGDSKGDSKGEPKKDSKPEPKKDGPTEPKQDSPKNDSKKEQPVPAPPKSDGGSGTGSKAEGSANAPA